MRYRAIWTFPSGGESVAGVAPSISAARKLLGDHAGVIVDKKTREIVAEVRLAPEAEYEENPSSSRGYGPPTQWNEIPVDPNWHRTWMNGDNSYAIEDRGGSFTLYDTNGAGLRHDYWSPKGAYGSLASAKRAALTVNPFTGPGVGPTGRAHVHEYERNPGEMSTPHFRAAFDLNPFSAALAKELKKLKRAVGATRVYQGYKGTGGHKYRRQIWVDVPWSSRGIDLWIERSAIGLGGIITPFGPGAKIAYGDKSPQEVYQEVEDVFREWRSRE